MQPLPEPATLLTGLALASTAEPVVARLLARAAAAARHHTGGGGFAADGSVVERPIADVLVRSVRRALINPELSLVGDAEPFCLRPGSFADWSLEEEAVLERYRTGPRS